MKEEFEQRYDRRATSPVQVWLFCRTCRCRLQVRTVPRPELPFRCFCGQSGTFAGFDCFTDEDEARRFAATFEEVYQTTKELLREAEMPLPATRMYRADEVKRIKAGQEPREDDDSEEGAADPLGRAAEDEAGFRRAVRELADGVTRAPDVIERHEALSRLVHYAFPRRAKFAEARRVAYNACETDVQAARDVLREATARWKKGTRVTLKFPSFKRLVLLLVEDRDLEGALGVATSAAQLGLPNFEEKVQKLKAQLGRR